MHFAPTENQAAFAAATRAVLRREATSDVVRQAWAEGTTPPVYWKSLLDLGLLTILAPEELGGGGSELELMAALVEVGTAAAPGPVVETAAVAVPLVAAFVPHLLEDEDWLRRGVTATTGRVVPHTNAGACLLLRDDQMCLIPLDGVLPLQSMDGSRATGELDDAVVANAQVLAEGSDVTRHLATARDRGALATAAVLLGLSRHALELTVEYTKTRRQFGVPIGSFQAVKHHLANAHVAIDMATPLLEAAAWALSEAAGGDSGKSGQLCAMAKVAANRAGRLTARNALQCHGAIGYTVEADLHLYLMRIWSLLNAWGGTGEHVDRVGASLGI
jgi:alkylation response protein AidB-like acyl-CoA dehydrogenase